jgi:hypothetical protein
MKNSRIDLKALCLGTMALAGAALLLDGCSGESGEQTLAEITSAEEDGASVPLSQLPFVDSAGQSQQLAELLPRPTALGETTALHVRLPPPRNEQLRDSLVRVVGQPDKPQLLFKSDALAQLGIIKKSPGKDFFTAFSTLPPEEIDLLQRQQELIASGRFGEVTNETTIFEGRSPVARTINPKFDRAAFIPGSLIPIAGCPITPVDSLAAWGKSLFIRDPAVIQDPTRTWDPCTGAGTKGGVWTFAHLMREMATGSGTTPENFALQWLSNWLNTYPVNTDNVAARTQMFNQVIQPWAAADGGTATLLTNPFTGKKFVSLSRPLNLDIAPFRLLAIVNRLDLGRTVSGPGGYGGSITDVPVTPGELRFIFGVVQPNPWGGGTDATCGKKRFTTIFEYGVPGEGCLPSVKWAKNWTTLQSMPGFTPAYLAQLQAMTESVVVAGAAPGKGNNNAINQIRTNEIALGGIWELREFTLTAENPPLNVDPPASGLLRTHSVAMTPNDGAFSAFGADPTINAFINGPVHASVPPGATNPNRCSSDYDVPYTFAGLAFRGGNALVPFAGPPGHWLANSITTASSARKICARHQFSLNTCHGCHRNDSGTNGLAGSTQFVHAEPLSTIPVTISKFLTGGGPGLFFNVADTQGLPAAPSPPGSPSVKWPFADLHNRLQRLFNVAFCTSCIRFIPMRPEVVEIFDFVPADIDPGDPPPFRVGPINDLKQVQELLQVRTQFAGDMIDAPGDFIRPVERASH